MLKQSDASGGGFLWADGRLMSPVPHGLHTRGADAPASLPGGAHPPRETGISQPLARMFVLPLSPPTLLSCVRRDLRRREEPALPGRGAVLRDPPLACKVWASEAWRTESDAGGASVCRATRRSRPPSQNWPVLQGPRQGTSAAGRRWRPVLSVRPALLGLLS